MKRILILISIGWLFSCNNKDEAVLINRQDLGKSIVEYSTRDSLFQDTLKIYNKGEKSPCVYQIWNHGELESESAIDKKGVWHNLKFLKKESMENREVFIDYVDEDSSFYAPYNKEIFQFFDKHKIITASKISNVDTTNFEIKNVPSDIYLLMSNDSTLVISKEGNNHKVITKKNEGDTILFAMIYYLYQVQSYDIKMTVMNTHPKFK